MKTLFIELLRIRHTIARGSMQWDGRAELVAAASSAGGLGTLTALTQPTPEALTAEACDELLIERMVENCRNPIRGGLAAFE